MNLFNRILLFLYLIAAGCLWLALFTVALGWQLPLEYLAYYLSQPDYRLIMTIKAGVMTLLAGYLLASLFRLRADRGDGHAVIQRTELGEVGLTAPAIEGMIVRAAKLVKGVRDVKVRQRLLPEGLAVMLNLTVLPERNLPPLSKEVQDAVKGHLTEVAGLEVVEVRVLISSLSPENARRLE